MLTKIYNTLLKHFGEQNWWPTITENREFEIITGAILTQNTSWKNVEKAIKNLNEKKLVSLEKINELGEKELALLIRPSGYYNQKAKKLKAFCSYAYEKHDGNLKKFLESRNLREELLGISGIGNETADSIILYAAKKPAFVVDAYTKRVFSRLKLIEEKSGYSEVQRFFTENLKKDEKAYNEYHALIVALGKNFCKKRPECNSCPVREICEGLTGPANGSHNLQ